MSDITEIKRMLADRAQAVCEHLLPAGRIMAGEWAVGSINGEAGKSLKVHLKGAKAGVWRDFAGDQGGDMIDLWRQVKRISLVNALDEIRPYLGVERPRFHNERKKTWTRPKMLPCHTPRGRVRDYLQEDRNLPAEIIERYLVGEDGDNIVFQFVVDGKLILCKIREARDGATPRPTEAGCEKILFGWQAISPDVREIVLTEGEIDAMSMAAYGFQAMSVPYGGGGGNKQDWIESEWERLERFETIFLAMDDDEPGREAVAEIAKRLGHHRCRVVTLPRKDANECLMAGVPAEDIQAAVEKAETLDPAGLRRVIEFTDQVVELFWPTGATKLGNTTPYKKLGDRLRFRPGEVTVWSGQTGSGKSQIISDCSVHWINEGAKCCLASLEMKPAQSLKRMVKQAVGTDRPTERAIHEAMAWIDAGMLIFALVGKSKLDALLEVFDYARRKYGCDTFIIDSLMRLGLETDDYNAQEQVMFRVVDWAIAEGVHVHFVAHSRKSTDGSQPRAEDIKGAMEIGANAFNIVTVWRNRARDQKLESTALSEEGREKEEAKPGVVITVAKQRNGDYEGRIGLWFDIETYQYRSSHESSWLPREYVSLREDVA